MQIDDGIFLIQFPDNHADDADKRDDRGPDDEVGAKPVVTLTFVQDHLQKTDADAQEADADEIDTQALLNGVRRIGDEQRGHQNREDADGNVDEKNPAPGEIVGNPAAESRTYGGSDDHAHAINGHGHALFFARETVHEDSLRNGLQAASAGALQHAKENERAEAWSKPAKERANGENCDAGHVELLAPKNIGEPAGQRQNDGVGDEVGSEHPSALVHARAETAGNVREGNVGDAGVEHFHERRQHYRGGDEPRIDVRSRAILSETESGHAAPFIW